MAPFTPDRAQRRVLDHVAGPLVASGAFGTGKTAVLRERFARLIEDGADADRVALVVGSRRARDEARSALLHRLDVALPSLTVVTMHGLAYHVLGERFATLGSDAPPTVLSAAQQFARVRELLGGEDPTAWPAYGSLLGLRGFADEVRQLAIRAQEALLEPEDVERAAAERGLGGWRELAAFLRTYLDVLDAAGEVDFAGLLVRAASAAREGEPLFDHLLIDDHQDATLAGEALLAAVRARSLVVAGNLEAHIFSFQGTTDAPLRRLVEEGPVAELETAYRPAPPVCDAWRAPHASEEHRAIAREVRRIHVVDRVPWGELAVVTRRFGAATAGLVRALDDAGIPRSTTTAGPPERHAATRPFVLALRWIAAGADRRDALAEPLLTSELGTLSPAGARSFLRLVRAFHLRGADVLERTDLAPDPGDVAVLEHLGSVLERAQEKRSSVLDAFQVLWTDLPYARALVANAGVDDQADADLDAVLAFSRAVAEAGSGPDGSVDAFLSSLDAAEGAPELAEEGERGEDAVHVLSAHATNGRSFDTVIVLSALEGDFPSLRRPEPMFDLEALRADRSRSEVNRARLAEERRLFSMVRHRARRRLLLTATDRHGDPDAVTLTSRFADELGVAWRPAPPPPVDEPVSVREARAAWRRVACDPHADPLDRLVGLDGLLTLGEDPRRWWFQRDWTDAAAPIREDLRLSYSRLDTLENCELQYVLSTELGLDPGGGYQAWVGRLVHQLIEDAENGVIERSPAGFHHALEARWDEARFPSYAISEAEFANARNVLVSNWFSRYAAEPAAAVEQTFEFEIDGARIRGKIDRIGRVPGGGTRITDYKTGRSDNAGRVAESLQLGIYYLAVNEVDELAPHRPIEAVELAFLGGKKKDPTLDVREWALEEGSELEYQRRVRERVSGLVARIRALDVDRRYVANTKAKCFFCGFKTLCARYPQGGAVFPIAAEPAPDATSAP